jgi:multiple sugar transport system substrate-binding protein
MRKLLVLTAFVMALGFGRGIAAADPITLKMWTFLSSQTSDPRSAALLSIMADFNKSQSEYRVEMQSIDFGRIDNMVIQATAANQGPDIVNVYSDLLSMHIAAKTLTPLDKYIASMSDAEKSDFIVPLTFMTFNGHVMALPWESRAWLYWYRSDLLEKTGAKLPQALDELGSVSGAVTTDSVMGFALGASEGQLGAGTIETFIPLLWGAGGDMVDSKGHAVFNSDAGVKTLTFLRDLITKYKGMRPNVVSMTADDVLSGIKAGTIAMTFQGSHRLSAARNAAATGANLKTAPIPGWTGDKPTPARLAAQTLAIGSTSKHPDGAWKFITFHLGRESQLKFAHAGVMPSRGSSYKDPFFTESPIGKEMQEWSVYAQKFGRMETLPQDYPKLVMPLVRAVQEVLVAGKDPKASLDAASTQYNALHP